MDYDGKVILGNVRENTIAEVYHNAASKEIRRHHLRGEFERIPLCEGCEARR